MPAREARLLTVKLWLKVASGTELVKAFLVGVFQPLTAGYSGSHRSCGSLQGAQLRAHQHPEGIQYKRITKASQCVLLLRGHSSQCYRIFLLALQTKPTTVPAAD